jgi:uncharacterized membrane protein YccC
VTYVPIGAITLASGGGTLSRAFQRTGGTVAGAVIAGLLLAGLHGTLHWHAPNLNFRTDTDS